MVVPAGVIGFCVVILVLGPVAAAIEYGGGGAKNVGVVGTVAGAVADAGLLSGGDG